MIRGIGLDVVGEERFAASLARTPRLRERLFAESERGLATRSLAARFAAKEALVKALGGSGALRWIDMEVIGDAAGAPSFAPGPALAAALETRGAEKAHVSLSHDAGLACAVVVVEGGA